MVRYRILYSAFIGSYSAITELRIGNRFHTRLHVQYVDTAAPQSRYLPVLEFSVVLPTIKLASTARPLSNSVSAVASPTRTRYRYAVQLYNCTIITPFA